MVFGNGPGDYMTPGEGIGCGKGGHGRGFRSGENLTLDPARQKTVLGIINTITLEKIIGYPVCPRLGGQRSTEEGAWTTEETVRYFCQYDCRYVGKPCSIQYAKSICPTYQMNPI